MYTTEFVVRISIYHVHLYVLSNEMKSKFCFFPYLLVIDSSSFFFLSSSSGVLIVERKLFFYFQFKTILKMQ